MVERAEPGFKDHFSARSDRYRAFRPRYPEALFDFLAANAPALELAWDCATGNGQAAGGLARHFGHVAATDASLAQLAVAEPFRGVRYWSALAERSALPDGVADCVVVAQALHWFAFESFWQEVRRVSRRGAIVAVWSTPLFGIEERIDEEIRRFYSDVVGRYWPPERLHVENAYSEIPFPFRPLRGPELTMSKHWNLDETCEYLRTWSSVARYRMEEGHDPVPGLRSRLRPVWGDPGRRREVEWRINLTVGSLE